MTATPAPPRPLSPLSAAALFDVLGYPLRGGALAVLVALLVMRLLAAALPLFLAPLAQALLWLALYKYALEALAASGLGRRQPPDVLATVDDSVHRRHLLIQVLVLSGLTVVLWLLPQWAALAVTATGLLLPGLLLALAVASNLPAALNPLNWLRVARALGPGYLMLAPAWAGLILFQVGGRELFAPLPGWLHGPLYYLLAHYAVLALFRWMGLHLHAHAAALGFELKQERKPLLQRDREAAALVREVRAAREASDPASRAAQLREAVRKGAEPAVQREYRSALRAAGLRTELDAHARVHACELVALGRLREAAALALEGLQDDPAFTLPEAPPLLALLDHLERLAQWRSAASLAGNYRAAYPRRRDSLAVAARAAVVLADELQDAAASAALLDGAIADAGDAAAAGLITLRKRLAAGLRLRGSLPG
jgi:hypothetical protein